MRAALFRLTYSGDTSLNLTLRQGARAGIAPAETNRRRFGTHPVDDCPADFM